MAPDEKSTSGSRIVFQDKASEDQQLPASESSVPGAVVSDTNNGCGTSSKHFRFLLSRMTLIMNFGASPHQRRILLALLERDRSGHQSRRGVRVEVILALTFF